MNGKTLGHYRVGEQLGRGGMGEVYVADDLSLDRKVALKLLPDAFTGDPERMARFEREAKLLASLNHPNIAGIYGLEQAEGKRFLVLELVEGETLAQRISKGALSIEEALGICRRIADGLKAAQEHPNVSSGLLPTARYLHTFLQCPPGMQQRTASVFSSLRPYRKAPRNRLISSLTGTPC